MIEKVNAIEIFRRNIGRTGALIEVMDKIKAYNRLYQMRESRENPKMAKIIKGVQGKQLAWIEQSCAEHAIISLATAFETYYKDLFQQLLADHSHIFVDHISNSSQIHKLIGSEKKVTFDTVEKKLKLNNRFDYIKLFKKLSIPFLSSKDADLVEYIFAKRKYYVHNANRPDEMITAKLKKIKAPVKEAVIKTEVKKLCTKLVRVVDSIDDKITTFLSVMADIAEKTRNYTTEFLTDHSCLDVLSLIPDINSCHDDLFGQLIYEYSKSQKIRVEIRAKKWTPEYPTRDIYINSAHLIFDPLIYTYNQKYSTRYRMVVAKEKHYEFPVKAKIAFDRFTNSANKNCMHPLDWKRLYLFVRTCHATKVNLSKEFIWNSLCKEGFDDDKAERIADITFHLSQFAKLK